MILIIDDDQAVRDVLQAILSLSGFDCEAVEDGDQAFSLLRRNVYQVVLLDLMLPGQNGFELLRFLKSERPAMLPRVILMTGVPLSTLSDFRDRDLCFQLVRKPLEVDELIRAVRACASQSHVTGHGPQQSLHN